MPSCVIVIAFGKAVPPAKPTTAIVVLLVQHERPPEISPPYDYVALPTQWEGGHEKFTAAREQLLPSWQPS